MIKLKASYIIAGVVIVSAAAMPLVSFAHGTTTKGLSHRGKAPLHAAFKPAVDDGTKHYVSGAVASVTGTSLTVTGTDGTTYAIDASSAKLFEPFGAPDLTLASIQVGDKVTVMGTITGTNVAAKSVTDQSFIGRNVFMGVVTAVSGSTVTIDSMVGKTKTTYAVDASAATLKKGVGKGAPTTIAVTDITVGDRITAVGTLSGTTVSATFVTDMGGKKKMMGKGMMPKPVMPANIHSGTVTAVSGSTITMDSLFAKTKTTYTVDVSAATLTKGMGKGTTLAVTDVKVGDKIMVTGPLTGANIAATAVRDLGIRKMMIKHGK